MTHYINWEEKKSSNGEVSVSIVSTALAWFLAYLALETVSHFGPDGVPLATAMECASVLLAAFGGVILMIGGGFLRVVIGLGLIFGYLVTLGLSLAQLGSFAAQAAFAIG